MKLLRAIANHPWTSLQDGLLLALVMLVASLLALEYNLFKFIAVLSDPQRTISLAEAIFLTILLAACIVAFVIRRLQEERRDVAGRVTAEIEMHKLEALASEDPLTGLANRRALMAALSAAAASCPSGDRGHVFFLIDLNHFKRINDRYGHPLGDQILQIVADRFRAVTRPTDILARPGGDEFGVLCYDLDQDAAYHVGMRFIATLASAIRVGGHSHKLSISVGAARIPHDGTTAQEILRSADLAMYSAKRGQHPSLMFFDASTSYPQQIA
jgi:diguanylate cyclase (GGDEF)-like protein